MKIILSPTKYPDTENEKTPHYQWTNSMVNILFLILAAVLLAVSVFSLYSYLKDIRRTKRVFIKNRR
ncbi:TPA: small membrane protein [Raoultella planticola]|uniref:small membrane protein n=1 Tax=Raoultella planticola TaxID=575 RepID=UPI000AC8B19A